MNLSHYQAFLRVVEVGSITAAAEGLGVSRPTLSRQLSAFERELGVALLHRSTREVRPTPAGRRLYERARPLLEELSRVDAAAREERDTVAGRLRVSAPPVLAPALSRLLVELRRQHPRLEVTLTADIRWAELRSDEAEVAVRAGRVNDPALIQRRLGSADISAVASPGYLERAGAPPSPEDLAAHQLLRGFGPEGEPQESWPLRGGGWLPVGGAFACNDQLALLEAALAGGGIALLSEVTAGRALAAGRLVRVLPERVGAELTLRAVYARRTLQPARVRTFVDALVTWFARREVLRYPTGQGPV
jgi:DNA-binding transcriptional LysR family regulator